MESPRVSALRLIDPPEPAALQRRRDDLLSRLQKAGRPLSAAEVAELPGLHLTTARFHLAAMVGEGLVEQATEPRTTPGRPRVLYAARAGAKLGPRSYGLLAEMLVELVASLPTSGAAPVETGRAWGRHLVERSAPSEPVGWRGGGGNDRCPSAVPVSYRM